MENEEMDESNNSEEVSEAASETEGAGFWAARSHTKQISLRLDEAMLERIKSMAEARHKSYQTMIKEFIGERLYQEEMREGILPALGHDGDRAGDEASVEDSTSEQAWQADRATNLKQLSIPQRKAGPKHTKNHRRWWTCARVWEATKDVDRTQLGEGDVEDVVKALAQRDELVRMFNEEGGESQQRLFRKEWWYRVHRGAYLDARAYNIEKAVHHALHPEVEENPQEFLVEVDEASGGYPMLVPVKQPQPEDVIAVESGDPRGGYKLMTYSSWRRQAGEYAPPPYA